MFLMVSHLKEVCDILYYYLYINIVALKHQWKSQMIELISKNCSWLDMNVLIKCLVLIMTLYESCASLCDVSEMASFSSLCCEWARLQLLLNKYTDLQLRSPEITWVNVHLILLIKGIRKSKPATPDLSPYHLSLITFHILRSRINALRNRFFLLVPGGVQVYIHSFQAYECGVCVI